MGLVYDFSDQINGFAKFSQGFSAPPFGDVISVAPDFAIGNNFDEIQPEKVDEYENLNNGFSVLKWIGLGNDEE